MALNLSNLKPAKGAIKRRKKVGRGGKRGTYSGKGMKGQKSRSGSSGLKALGFKQTLQRTPKLRGFKSLQAKMEIVNLGDLDKFFKDGDVVDVNKLLKTGLVNTYKNGVKVLSKGKLEKKLTVVANKFSQTAQKAIEEAGGKIEIAKKDNTNNKKKDKK